VSTLRALNRQAEHAFADAIHTVEHRVHAKLFGIDDRFLVRIECRIRADKWSTSVSANSMLNEEGGRRSRQFRMDACFDRMVASAKACSA